MVTFFVNCPIWWILFIFFTFCVWLSYGAGFSVQPATNWNDAILSCKAVGMKLAVVKDADKANEVQTFLTASNIQVDFWMGLYYDTQTQLFRWVDDSYIESGSYTNWAANEPDALDTDHCVRLRGVEWRTMKCTSTYNVLCEHRMPITDRTTPLATEFRAIVSCPSDADSICMCEIIKNVSASQKNLDVGSILRIDKKKTSAFIRNHHSAADGRFSASVMGYSGTAVLVCIALLIVCADFTPTKRQSSH